MATPHVTGAAALWLATHPADTPIQVAAGLTGNATPGIVTDPGDGSPNLLLYLGTAPVPPPPPPPVCANPGERLVNPGFESGYRGWLATAGAGRASLDYLARQAVERKRQSAIAT